MYMDVYTSCALYVYGCIYFMYLHHTDTQADIRNERKRLGTQTQTHRHKKFRQKTAGHTGSIERTGCIYTYQTYIYIENAYVLGVHINTKRI